MEANYLIAYPKGETAEILIESLIDKGNSLIVVSPQKHKQKKDSLSYVSWNPKSPLSAKNALLSVQNANETFPIPILVFPDIEQIGMSTHQLSYAHIDSWIDTALRGMLFFIKECIQVQKSSPKKLILCLGKEPSGLNGTQAMLYNAMYKLGEGLFTEYADSGFYLYGFENRYDNINRFADFVIHQLPQLSKKHEGKWNIGGDRSIFFSNKKK